jgi:hypothetical protein
MKSLLIGFVCLISHSTHAIDIGSSECDIIQQNERSRIAQEIYDHKPIVPSVIYHFGKKDYLLQDVEANTIPLDVWQNNIMGKKSS